MTEIIERELSYRVAGCVFDVHNGVGPGVREECYQKAMEQRLLDGEIPFLAKPATRRELVYRGQVVDVFEPDLIVEPVFHERRLPRSPISPFIVNDLVCLQVEAIHDDVSARLIRTMQTHLRWTGKPFGCVATFGRRKLSIRGVKP